MLPDEHYICQSAANAIISQVGPLRISSDALQAVNQFLDEFIQLLVIQLKDSSSDFSLSKLKQACFQLLPNMLGKNAVVEAELEVKNIKTVETSFEYDLPFIRKKCLEHCTLADKTKNNSNKTDHAATATAAVVYMTAILEHVGEYILTCIATVADDQQDTEFVRVKDVFFALIEDAQLSLLFSRMDLHDKIEKRVSRSISISRPHSCYLPMTSTATTQHNNKRYTANKRNSVVEINFDDLELEYFEEDNHNNVKRHTTPQVNSTVSQQQRSFNKKRTPRVQSVYAPDKPNMNFEDLIKSNNTVKVSLTPNRLKSIEVKDHRKADDNESWLRRRSSTTLASIKRLASNMRPNSSPVGKKKEEQEQGVIRKKGEQQDSIKRPASTPPSHRHREREKLSASLQRSQSPLSISSISSSSSSSAVLETKVPSSPNKNSNIPISTTVTETATTTTTTTENNASHMSIPSLSMSDISKSRYSTSSIASTLSSSPSVLKELSSVGEEEKKSCAIISSPPSTFPSIDSHMSKLNEQQHQVVVLDNKKIPFENKQQQQEEIKQLKHQTPLPEQVNEASLPATTITKQPERPSSIVARRAYRIGNSRPKSFHEHQATEKYSTLFSKEIKSTTQNNGDIEKTIQQADTGRTSHLVLDKVLKFELASSYEPKGERFLYLQQQRDSINLQRRRTMDSQKCPVDRAVQTEDIVAKEEEEQEQEQEEEEEEEVGVIDGDEEWFIQDDELDEQDEADIVNWLLGE